MITCELKLNAMGVNYQKRLDRCLHPAGKNCPRRDAKKYLKPLSNHSTDFESHVRKRVSIWRIHVAPYRILSLATAFFPTKPEAVKNVMSKGPTMIKEEQEQDGIGPIGKTNIYFKRGNKYKYLRIYKYSYMLNTTLLI